MVKSALRPARTENEFSARFVHFAQNFPGRPVSALFSIYWAENTRKSARQEAVGVNSKQFISKKSSNFSKLTPTLVLKKKHEEHSSNFLNHRKNCECCSGHSLTALLCSTLLFSALLCSTLLFSAVFCFTLLYLLYFALFCFILFYSALLCSTLLYSALLCLTLLYSALSALLCFTLLYSALLCFTLFYSIILYCTL